MAGINSNQDTEICLSRGRPLGDFCMAGSPKSFSVGMQHNGLLANDTSTTLFTRESFPHATQNGEDKVEVVADDKSPLERFEEAAREQGTHTVGFLRSLGNGQNWHSSAVIDYIQPMSPSAVVIRQSMQTTIENACRSWGVTLTEDDVQMSPRGRLFQSIPGWGGLSSSVSHTRQTFADPSDPIYERGANCTERLTRSRTGRSLTMSTRSFRTGNVREIDPSSVVKIFYKTGQHHDVPSPLDLLVSATTLRELRAYLAKVHRCFIPQISLYNYDTAIRFDSAQLDISPCPVNVLVQVMPTNPLPFGPTFFEHVCAKDIDTARTMLVTLKDKHHELGMALHYFTLESKKLPDACEMDRNSILGLTMLLQANADVNMFSASSFYTGCESTCLFNAICNERLDIVAELLDGDADPGASARFAETVFSARARSMSPLAQACELGNLDIVKLLVCFGASVNESDSKANAKPPIFHLVNPSVPNAPETTGLISFLHQSKCNIEKTFHGMTPLAHAIVNRRQSMVHELCMVGVSVSRMIDGYGMIHLAAITDDTDVMEMLVAYGARINAETLDGARLTPLHIATRQCDHNPSILVDYLLANNAHVNAVDSLQETPLYAAMRARSNPVIAALVKAKADVCERRNREGLTAIDVYGSELQLTAPQ